MCSEKEPGATQCWADTNAQLIINDNIIRIKKIHVYTKDVALKILSAIEFFREFWMNLLFLKISNYSVSFYQIKHYILKYNWPVDAV